MRYPSALFMLVLLPNKRMQPTSASELSSLGGRTLMVVQWNVG